MNNPGKMKHVLSRLIAALFSLSMVILFAGAAEAALNCTSCHGVLSTSAAPVDTPPGSLVTYRNLTTGAVKGNHGTHVGAVTTGQACAKCHGAATATYQPNHALTNSFNIQMNAAVGYNKGAGTVTSFAQTATPTLGTCTTANCHFQRTTPAWGQDATFASQKGAGTDASNTCAQCHDGTAIATGKHAVHLAALGNSLATCAKCHPDNLTPAGAAAFSHVTSSTTSIRIRFSAAPNNGVGSASPLRVAPAYLPSAATPSTATCSNVYCHSVGNLGTSGNLINSGGVKYRTPNWNGAAIGCDGCHGDQAGKSYPVYASGLAGYSTANSHIKHIEGRVLSCDNCHYNTVTQNTIPPTAVRLNDYSGHLNRAANVRMKPKSYAIGTYNVAQGQKVCSNIYCHSNGRPDKPQYSNPKWGDNTSNCLTCHGGRTGAAGTYTFSAAGFRLTTTHSQHLKYPAANINCQMCHSKTMQTDAVTLLNYSSKYIKHGNAVKDVTFTDITYGNNTSYKSSRDGNRCGNISCHGGKTRNGWSTTTINTNNTCVHCHGVAVTSAALSNSGDNRKFFAPGWNKTGTDTDGESSRQNAQVGAHFKHLSSIFMKKIKCNECHIVPNSPFDGGHMAQTRFTVSQTLRFDQASTAKLDGVTGTTLAVFTGYTTGTSLTDPATCSSVYCHGNRTKYGVSNGSYRKPYWNFSGMTNNSTDRLAVTCGRCHGNPPNTVLGSHAGQTPTTSCTGCHGVVVDSSGRIINKLLHINGEVNASACTACHGYPPTSNSNMVSNPSATNALGGSVFNAHSTHTKVKMMDCTVCHNGFTAAGMGSAPGAIEIGFAIDSANWSARYLGTTAVTFGSFSGNQTLNSTYTYSAVNSPGTLVRTGNGTRNSCNVYCHGAWPNSGKKINPSWIGTSQTTCGNCHNATVATPPTNGSHTRHVATYQNSCTTCHPGRTPGIHHVDGSVQWKFSTSMPKVGASASYSRAGATGNGTANGNTRALASNGSYGTCNGIYCHSSGRSDVAQYNTPTWGGTTNCRTCHGGRDSALGNYVPSTGGFRLSTTHAQHLGKYPAANINCNICHSKTATDAATLLNYSSRFIKHANNIKDVSFTNVAYGNNTSYKSSRDGNRCGNVSCHGGKSRNGWSTTTINTNNTCVHCHGVAVTSAALSNSGDNRKFFAPGWNKTGTDTDGESSRQNAQVGAHFKHLSSIFMKKIKCNECHIVPNSPFDGGHMAQARFTVSQTLRFDQASTAKWNGVNSTTLAVFTGYTTGTSLTDPATCSSVYCHGNRIKNGVSNGSYRKPMWNYSGMTNNSADRLTVTCGRCHGNPPDTVPGSHTGVTPTTGCSTCHGTMVNAAGIIINKALHIDGIITAASCTACHGNPPTTNSNMVSNPSATNALGGSVFNAHSTHNKQWKIDCNACHNGYTAAGMGQAPGAIQIGFAINNTNWSSRFVSATPITFGSFSGNQTLLNGYTYTSSSAGTLVRTGNGTRNSCNVYCHGGWTGSAKKVNPSWIGSSQVVCGNCHGATVAAPLTSSSHTRHVSAYKNSCTTCHPGRPAGMQHIEGSVQWKFSTSKPKVGAGAIYTRAGATGTGTSSGSTNSPATVGAYGTCNGIYCHSSGRSQFSATPTWGGATTCLSCHGGRDSALGNYAPSISGFRLSTTHAQHLKYPAASINCNMCHARTASDAATLVNYSSQFIKHANTQKDVVFTTPVFGTLTSYKSGRDLNKCGNVSCHGGKTRNGWSTSTINNNNTCVHCHGVGTTSAALGNTEANRKFFAPGWGGTGISTDGITAATDIRVGAHFLHLSSSYMKKLKCNECHIVPDNPFSANHIAAPRFTSQTISFAQASTATRNNLVFVSYTSGTPVKAATCSTTYCHGSKMIYGSTLGTNRKPSWNQTNYLTGTPSPADCGTCHGAPPNTSGHVSNPNLNQCTNCHGHLNAGGSFRDKSLHINGSVEVSAACNGCHDYDTTGGGTTWGKTDFGGFGQGSGAHAKHIEHFKARFNVTLNADTDTFGSPNMVAVCGMCHTITPANHTPGTSANPRTINFGDGTKARQFGPSAPFYNGVYNTSSAVNAKNCSNIDCHFKASPVWP